MTGAAATVILALCAALAGLGAGWVHFSSLRGVADRIVAGQLGALGWQLLRLALLGGFLWICAQGGAAVLLAAACGILAGRVLVLRRVR
ncbi:MAG: hypothetical protein KDA73_05555 [Rhodobacteraceae bacterium]|nr:hypothetical protein [Paracoccaceae bacterium]